MDTNAAWDVFVRDVAAGTTELISVSMNGGVGNGSSGNDGTTAGGSGFQEVAISNDGRYVAFISRASDLVPNDTNNAADVFVRDRQMQTTTRVSVATGGTQATADAMGRAAENVNISGNGQFVVFGTWATNMVAGDTNNQEDVYLHDRNTGVTERISLSATGAQPNQLMRSSAISFDGRFVAFDGSATNIMVGTPGGYYIRDRMTNTIDYASRATGATGSGANSACCGDISDDGRWVMFQTAVSLEAADTNAAGDLYLRDRQNNTTVRLSVDANGNQGTSSNGPGGAFTRNGAMDAAGRFVAMHTPCGFDPIRDLNDPLSDVYVRDRTIPTTYLLDRIPATGAAAGPSVRPRMSANGTFITFESISPNLVTPDNTPSDIYRVSNCAP